MGLAGEPNTYIYPLDPLTYIDRYGLRRGNGKPGNGPPVIGVVGCIGIACVSSTPRDSAAQLSLELALGGAIEICDPPRPKAEIGTCPNPKRCGRFDRNCDDVVQPPGFPIPKRLGGVFVSVAIKRDGRFCIRIGPHVSPPLVPSIDVGGLDE